VKTRLLAIVMFGLVASSAVAAAPLTGSDYQTAYDALVAAGDIESAYRLALKRRSENPDSTDWLRRLARTALWTERPVESYKAWKRLYRLGKRDSEVMKNLNTLAEHFEDAPLLLELWQRQAGHGKLSLKQVERLAALYERANRPLDGARQLGKHYRRYRQPATGNEAARLYRRAGDDPAALRIYLSLIKHHPAQEQWLVTAARIQVRLGRFGEAYRLLKRHRRSMPDNAEEYWKLLAELAWQQQDDQIAQEAFALSLSARSDRYTRERFLYLTQKASADEAAEKALHFFHQTGRIYWLQRALSLQLMHGQWDKAQQSLELATAEQLKELERDPRFLLLRGQLRVHFGNRRGALSDLRHAMQLGSDEIELQLNALWLAIACNSRQEMQSLANALRSHLHTPGVMQALAAAYGQLGEQRRAIALYRRLLERKPDNPLLLLDYADQLTADARNNEALNSRRQALLLLSHRNSDKADNEARLAQMRLQLTDHPGDTAAQRIRQWLEHPSKQPEPERLSELLLSQALANGQRQNALSWRRQRLQKGQSTPLWARLQLALARHDRITLQQLLADNASDLPPADAGDAALQLGRWPLARQLSFETAQQQSDTHWPRQRLAEIQQRYGDYLQLGLESGENDTFDYTDTRLTLYKALAPSWAVELQQWQRAQRLNDHALLSSLPDSLRGTTLTLHHHHADRELSVAFGKRNGMTDYNQWALDLTLTPRRRLQLTTSVSGGEDENASTALEALGYSNRASFGLRWQLDKRVYVSAELGAARYHDHYGSYLGQGRMVDWETGYLLRGDYPDLQLRLWGSHLRTTADGEASAQTLPYLTDTPITTALAAEQLIADDNDTVGVCASAGLSAPEEAYRALRPMAELCGTRSSNQGNGYSFMTGLDTRIANGRLDLAFHYSRNNQSTGSTDWKRLTLQYRYDF